MFALLSILVFLISLGGADHGVRWQAQRDTALDLREAEEPKRRRRFALPAHSKQSVDIKTTFDEAKNRSTVRLAPVQISGEKDKYYSLHIAAAYSYPGRVPQRPETIDFELRSVVKARKLKIDLYVEFVVDGEKVFLSSSRSAIKNPVRGRPWVGERLIFRVPYETLLKITKAQQFEIKMDAVTFGVGEKQLEALREFVRKISADSAMVRKRTSESHSTYLSLCREGGKRSAPPLNSNCQSRLNESLSQPLV